MPKTEFISLTVSEEIKNGLQRLKEKDGSTLSYHITKAITNYLKSKKILKN